MRTKALDVRQYSFTSHDELLLDANIWLYLYGPQRPGDKRTAAYSQAFAKILSARSRICIDVLIVSEFINTYARLQWDVMGRPSGNFKEFRKSRDFKPIAADIAAAARRVLKHCTCVESEFATLDANQIISEYETGDSDFNDQVIAALCRKKGLKLVTHDSDFYDQGISVLTMNPKMLA